MFNAGNMGKGGGKGNGDAKSMLNQMLQKLCARPIAKTDVVYTTNQFDTQYQAILKLHCLEGKEYAGHLMSSLKEAEKSAAEQAMAANAPLLAQLQQQPKGAQQQKRAASATPAQPAAKKPKAPKSEGPALPHKTDLNNALAKILRRSLIKGEVEYICNSVGEFFQATLQISCLPDMWSGKAWAGELKPTKGEAEQSAAEQALSDVANIPAAEKPAKAKKEKAASAEPGTKKPKAEKKQEQQASKQEKALKEINELMNSWTEQVSKQTGEQNLASKMLLWMMEGGKGKPPREIVRAQPISGTVVQWKEKTKNGYLKPDAPLNHEGEEFKEGKVWVGKKDLPEGIEDLVEGMKVKFKVYYDPQGLGATDVTLV